MPARGVERWLQQHLARTRGTGSAGGHDGISANIDFPSPADLADRIVVMNKGRIEQMGTPDEIYRRPATVFVADFIGSANFLEPSAVSFAGGVANVRVLGSERPLPYAPGAEQAETHSVLVRPESVHVQRAREVPTEGDAVVGGRGRVLRAVFYGAVVEYEIDTNAGTIVAVVADPDPSAILHEGDLVEVDFPPSRGWLLPA